MKYQTTAIVDFLRVYVMDFAQYVPDNLFPPTTPKNCDLPAAGLSFLYVCPVCFLYYVFDNSAIITNFSIIKASFMPNPHACETVDNYLL
jgi:hypothetical protein